MAISVAVLLAVVWLSAGGSGSAGQFAVPTPSSADGASVAGTAGSDENPSFGALNGLPEAQVGGASVSRAPVQVDMVGDSLLGQSNNAIASTLGAGYQVSTAWQHGVPIDGQIDKIGEYSADADVIVLLLGTNDLLDDNWVDRDEASRDIASALDATRPVGCVVWATVQSDLDRPELAERAEQFNSALVESAERFPQLQIADFASRINGHPSFNAEDGLHLTNDGAWAMSYAVVEAMERCPSDSG
ncbi:MAG: hypothetical protein JJLCMIEE_00405 [Acidimicrobiales bacterium]|nr:hypothetical protein [Acidimicrobiales bacterium]